MRAAAALLLLATTTACSVATREARQDSTAEMAQALAGYVAEAPRRCITLSTTAVPRVIGESLLYRDGRRLYRSDAVDGCASLAGDPIVVVETWGGQLCANDRFRTLPRQGGIPGPYCRFGDFVPYARTAR